MVLDGGRRRTGPAALRGGSAAVIGLEEKMLRDDHFLRREYGRTLIPVMFSVLAGTINTLIDSAFVAQRIGNDALAAVNMCGPLYQLICTFGSLLAGGASILSSGEAGRDDMESSRRYYHTALLLGLAVGALATAAGLFFCAPISLLLSQGGALSGYVYDYSLATFAGLIPVVIAYLPLYYLQLEGKGKEIMIMMGIVIGTDVVLDWVFLYLFDFGMAGAAAASVLSMAASCVYGFLALQEEHSAYRFDGRLLGFKGTWEILKYGSPAAVGNLMDAVRLFLLNSLILLTLGTKGAAVWAVLNSLSELSLCISSGVPDDRGLPFGEGKQRHPDPSFQPACVPEAVFLSAGGGPCSGGLRRAVLALSAAGRRFGRLLLRGRYRRGFPEKREGRALSFPVPFAGRLSGTGRAGAGFFHCAFGAEYLRCQRPDPGVLHPQPYGPKGHEPHRHGD